MSDWAAWVTEAFKGARKEPREKGDISEPPTGRRAIRVGGRAGKKRKWEGVKCDRWFSWPSLSTLLSDAFVHIVSSSFLFYITFSFLMCSHSLLIFNIYCIWFLSFYHFSSLLMCPSDILLHFLLFFIACCPPLIFIYLVPMFLLMLSLFPLYVRCSNASLIFIVRLYSFPFLPFPPTSLISWRIPPSLFLWIFFSRFVPSRIRRDEKRKKDRCIV